VNPVFGGAPDRGAVGAVAQPLFTEHLLAFELTSILLLAAIVGAVALGKRRIGGVP
jgi:NADH-quinone oxidoreductase subunit J